MKSIRNIKTHMKELKNRLLRVLAGFFGLFFFCFYCSKEIFLVLAMPLKDTLKAQGLVPAMIYTNPLEAFSTYMDVAFFGALFLVFPYLEWEIWCFMSPGLLKKEKKNWGPFLVLFPCLFIMGGFFAYWIIIPTVWNFFIQFSAPTSEEFSIRLLAQMGEYLAITMKFIFTFGLCFQLPLIMLLLAHIGFGSAAFFAEKRRFIVLGIFFAAALLTPPDVLSQIMLALPLWALYELSIVVIKLKEKSNYHA